MKALQLVQIKEGKVVANTRDLAELFGKQHKNVLQKIDAKLLDYSEEFRQLNFQPTSFLVELPKGGHREDRMYELTRNGFTAIAMTFSGKKAGQFQEMVINEFERMSRQLEQLSIGGSPAVVFMENALKLLKTHESDIHELKEKVRHLELVTEKPRVDAKSILDAAIKDRLAELNLNSLPTLVAIRGFLKRRYQVDRYYLAPVEDALEYIKIWSFGMYL